MEEDEERMLSEELYREYLDDNEADAEMKENEMGEASITAPVNAGCKKDVSTQFEDGTKRKHAIQLRHLVLTARKEIDSLRHQLREAQLKTESSCVVQCPDCTKVFKDRDCIMHPKYIKIIKSSNTLELSFEDAIQMQEWLVVSGLEKDKQGNTVYVQKTVGSGLRDGAQSTLKESNSRIPSLYYEMETKKATLNAETTQPKKESRRDDRGERERRKRSRSRDRDRRREEEEERERTSRGELKWRRRDRR